MQYIFHDRSHGNHIGNFNIKMLKKFNHTLNRVSQELTLYISFFGMSRITIFLKINQSKEV